jgi:type II secretory pathway component PulK
LQEYLGADRANQVLAQIGAGAAGGGGPGGGGPGGAATLTNTFTSVLEFYLRSGLTADEFELIEGYLTTSTNTFTEGLVNVNTASEAVLACLPGIGFENAPALVAARQSHPGATSVSWVKDVLDEAAAIQAGPHLTGRSYQFTADLAAVGRYGRGYQRVRYVFDTSEGAPRVMARQDLTHLGWALGAEVREWIAAARQTGTPAFGGGGPGAARWR